MPWRPRFCFGPAPQIIHDKGVFQIRQQRHGFDYLSGDMNAFHVKGLSYCGNLVNIINITLIKGAYCPWRLL